MHLHISLSDEFVNCQERRKLKVNRESSAMWSVMSSAMRVAVNTRTKKRSVCFHSLFFTFVSIFVYFLVGLAWCRGWQSVSSDCEWI